MTGTKTYYPVAGAMRVGSTLYYVLKDHLGSASVVTDSTGATVGEDRFYPFGATRFTTGNMQTDKLFTGQREMAGLGIYHFGARFYSPYINRFLSADSMVPSYANPQSLNRYSYVNNSPLNYTDPSGHMMTPFESGGGVRYAPSPIIVISTKTPTKTPTKAPTSTNTPTSTSTPTSTFTSTSTATSTASMTATVTPMCSNPSNLCATSAAAQLTAIAYQPTYSASLCDNNLQTCIRVPTTPTPWPTATAQPTSEFWAIVREEHTPLDVTPSQRIPPGFNYDFWQAVDTTVKSLLPLFGYPATTKNIADVLSGQAAVQWTVETVGPAITTIVSRGSGIYFFPKESLIFPPSVSQ